jgi:hypothetical protein
MAPATSRASASTGTTFIWATNLQRVAARRVVNGHHQATATQHQRQHLAPVGHREGQAGDRLGIEGEGLQVDQGVAHLARQGHLEIDASHHALAHQQFAQRHAALATLLFERLGQLLFVDVAHRDQGLADAHHRHLVLLFERLGELVCGHDLAQQQHVAQPAAAQLGLGLQGVIQCARRRHLVFEQHLAQARPDVELDISAARHEDAAHAPHRVDGLEQEQADRVVEVADGLPLQRRALAHHQAVGQGRAIIQGPGRLAAVGAGQGRQRLGQHQAPELRQAQGQRCAHAGYLQLQPTVVGQEGGQPARHALAVHALDLAGFGHQRKHRLRVAGQRWRRPGEGLRARRRGIGRDRGRRAIVQRDQIQRRLRQIGHADSVCGRADRAYALAPILGFRIRGRSLELTVGSPPVPTLSCASAPAASSRCRAACRSAHRPAASAGRTETSRARSTRCRGRSCPAARTG